MQRKNGSLASQFTETYKGTRNGFGSCKINQFMHNMKRPRRSERNVKS